MNAYELAKEIDWLNDYCYVQKAANMLRQQADRIAELEKELNHMRSFFGCDPAYYGMKQSEPVGYVYSVADEPIKNACIKADLPNGTPLYTTPQTKPLSDEEIKQIFINNLSFMVRTNEDAHNLIACARAIEAKVRGEK